jgi:acetyl-CoA acetyltransferase
MVCNEKGLQKLGLKPRVKVIGMAVAGSCPVTMLDGPIPAT